MRVARQSQLPIVIKVKRAGAIEKATVATTCCSSETVKVKNHLLKAQSREEDFLKAKNIENLFTFIPANLRKCIIIQI